MPKKNTKIQSVKGMHDVLPDDQRYWEHTIQKSSALLEYYGFKRIDTPIVEEEELFSRSVGEGTDIVEKEMYTMSTKSGDKLALRPENTASIVRSYIEHGMNVLPRPVKLYYSGPMFRHDRPQAGRLRQFHQLGIEVIGEESAALDAEVIFILYKIFQELGLKDISVCVNSIGDKNCRPVFMRALKDYYRVRNRKLCAECKNRYRQNILRLLDCKELSCIELRKDAPQFVDYLDESCKNHFKLLLEFLDALQVPYVLDPYLVRGLSYYTRTVFEFIEPGEEKDSKEPTIGDGSEVKDGGQKKLSLGSGGRYDDLVELLGGKTTPSIGWAIGMERVVNLIKQREIKILSREKQPKVFVAQLGDIAKRKSLLLLEDLRKTGITAVSSLGRDSIKSQLRIANKLGVVITLIIGQREVFDNNVIFRDMESSIQEVLPMAGIVQEIRNRLKK